MLSKFLKTHFDKICMKFSFPQGFLRMRVSPKNHQKFDIIVLSEFFKVAKWENLYEIEFPPKITQNLTY